MNDFPDKFHLSPEQSIFLAKKKRDENIYCGMRMENRAVTFPQTQTILNGVNVPNVKLDDIQAILNMRDAWRFILNTVNDPLSLDYICKLNGLIVSAAISHKPIKRFRYFCGLREGSCFGTATNVPA